MAKVAQITVAFGSRVAEVRCSEGHEPVTRCPEPFDGQELAVLAVITETIRAWSAGVPIDRHFNPTKSSAEDLVLVLCLWERSGKLIVKEEVPERKYQHADTVDEAVQRKRSFTCYRSLVSQLPSRREKET